MTFRFYSNPNNTQRVAIVGKHENGILKLAVSLCNKKDNFMKKKGRAIAEGRLNKNKLYKSITMNECSGNRFVEEATNIVNEVISSKRVVI
jgi:hypothetical protein